MDRSSDLVIVWASSAGRGGRAVSRAMILLQPFTQQTLGVAGWDTAMVTTEHKG